MSKIAKDFKEFIAGGNIIEFAVALIMGGLIGSAVKAMVEHILMPIIGIFFGKPDFNEALILTINDSQIRFGSFLTVLVTVVLTALGVFLFVVKPYQRMQKAKTAEAAGPTEADLLIEIRDLLARR